MTIIGTGLDATEIDRIGEAIGRFGERLVRRVYTEGEIAFCRSKRVFGSSFGSRFAALESAL
jgi:holo-[acyl-carrier protein] synthase